MFTGIIEEIGTVRQTAANALLVAASKTRADLALGDSVAVNGVCLTVTARASDSFAVETMPETLRRTNLGLLRTGDRVNLERALVATGRLGGHFVQGHVDGTGRIVALRPEGDALLVHIEATSDIMRYIVSKGFIAVDGASLTVVAVDAAGFHVSLVGFTQRNIILPEQRLGHPVNLEVDIIAKYVERFTQGGMQQPSRVTMEFLSEHGFR